LAGCGVRKEVASERPKSGANYGVWKGNQEFSMGY
jgi:hypothetical protein